MKKIYSIINLAYQIMLPIFLIALGVQCTLTTLDNRKLKKELEAKWLSQPQSPTLQAAAPEVLTHGEKITPFKAQDIQGVERNIQQGTSKDFLLLAFSTTCPACRNNVPNWKEITQKIDLSRWEVIGLSTDDVEKTKAYATEHGFNFPVISLRDKQDIKNALKIRRIPTTMAIDHNLVAQNVWIGVLTSRMTEVRKNLDISEE